jgi:hypothetical protein
MSLLLATAQPTLVTEQQPRPTRETMQTQNRAIRAAARQRQRRYAAQQSAWGVPRASAADRALARALRWIRYTQPVDQIGGAELVEMLAAEAADYLSRWGYEPIAAREVIRRRLGRDDVEPVTDLATQEFLRRF